VRARLVLVLRRPEAFGLRAAHLFLVGGGAHGTYLLQLLDMRELDGRVDVSLEQAGRQVLHEERPVEIFLREPSRDVVQDFEVLGAGPYLSIMYSSTHQGIHIQITDVSLKPLDLSHLLPQSYFS